MTTRETVLNRLTEIERAELKKSQAAVPGTVRDPLGSNNVKYNTAYYGFAEKNPDKAWCVVFQWWCFMMASIPMSVFPKTAGVLAARKFFQDHHRYFHTPMPGDLVVFIRGPGDQHIGFVEKLTSDIEFQTIEGNVNSRVVRGTHRRDEPHIDGYCRPEYHKVQEELSMADAGDILSFLQKMKQEMVVFGTTGLEKTVEDFATRQRQALAKLDQLDARLTKIEQHLNIQP